MNTCYRILSRLRAWVSQFLHSLPESILILGLLAALTGTPAWAAGSVAYTYDALGRLSKATYSTGAVITYVYDAAGNRTSAVTTGVP